MQNSLYKPYNAIKNEYNKQKVLDKPTATDNLFKAAKACPKLEIPFLSTKHGTEKHIGGSNGGSVFNLPVKNTEKEKLLNDAFEGFVRTRYEDTFNKAISLARKENKTVSFDICGYIKDLGIPGYTKQCLKEGVTVTTFRIQVDVGIDNGKLICQCHGYPCSIQKIGLVNDLYYHKVEPEKRKELHPHAKKKKGKAEDEAPEPEVAEDIVTESQEPKRALTPLPHGTTDRHPDDPAPGPF